MTGPFDAAVYGSLFIAGIAGSLHCLGMCGPILLAFSQVAAGGVADGRSRLASGVGRTADSLLYHAGRVWTYGLLGFVAGLIGAQARGAAAVVGWQRPLAVSASALVLVAGMAALGLLPGLRLPFSMPAGCAALAGRWGWLGTLVRARSPLARLLLGAVMGLLPCGLVYAMLVVAAGLRTPVESALGMIVFGAGTTPALTALLVAAGAAPARLRARSPRLAAGLLVVVGVLMLARSIFM